MDMQDLFKYELCSSPAALFKTTFVPRQAEKSVLAEEVKLKGSSLKTAKSLEENPAIDNTR